MSVKVHVVLSVWGVEEGSETRFCVVFARAGETRHYPIGGALLLGEGGRWRRLSFRAGGVFVSG